MATEPEIKAVAYVLEQDHTGKSTADVARACIKALDDLRSTIYRAASGPLKRGETFKGLTSSKVNYVAWIGDMGESIRAWIVTEESDYGWFSHPNHEQWRWRKPSTVRDITRFTVNKDGHLPGDVFTIDWGGGNLGICTAVAVAPASVLTEANGIIIPIGNWELEKFYKKVK